MAKHSFTSHKTLLFEAKIPRFLVIFINFTNSPIDFQAFTKTSKTRVFSTSYFLFQKNATF